MDPDPLSISLLQILQPVTTGIVLELVIMLVLLILSALISGSEVAFFSLSPQDRDDLEAEESRRSKRVVDLLSRPNALLATILIGNNLVLSLIHI